MEALQTDIRAEFEPAFAGGKQRSRRSPVSLDTKLGRGGLDRTLCRVTDLSRQGARISSYSAMKKDASIWLTLPGIGQIAATVRWADDFCAGCQFDEPLPDYQFDMLVAVGRA